MPAFAAAAAAVSERDLIEGIKRSASVANQAGVDFNELVGVITAVQQKTARGGAVIGNSFKTIFTRLQSFENLSAFIYLSFSSKPYNLNIFLKSSPLMIIVFPKFFTT